MPYHVSLIVSTYKVVFNGTRARVCVCFVCCTCRLVFLQTSSVYCPLIMTVHCAAILSGSRATAVGVR